MRRPLACLLVFSLAFACAALAAVGIVRVGPEIEVAAPAPGEGLPSVCAMPDGSFVVARRDTAGGIARIAAQRLGANGASLGSELVVSTDTTGDRIEPDVACGAAAFAVVWADYLDAGARNDVLARVYDDAGVPLSLPMVVNEYTTGNQETPAVCAQGGGRFAVVWQDRRRDELDARVISADGPQSAAMLVAEDPRSFMDPDVACASNGKFLAVWGDFPSTEVNDEVAARLFSANGEPEASRFFVNAYTTGDQGYPVACGASGGGFVVAWRDARSRRGGGIIKARRISAAGKPAGAGFDVTPEGRTRAEITCGSAGGFVISTRADDDGINALLAQAVDAAAQPVGGEAIVRRTATALGDAAPPVGGDADGRFLVVWPVASFSGEITVRGQRLEIGEVQTTTTSTLQLTTTTIVQTTECGDAFPDGQVSTLDALIALRAAVGSVSCDPCTCDVDSSGSVTVQDALRILSYSVGLDVVLACPTC